MFIVTRVRFKKYLVKRIASCIGLFCFYCTNAISSTEAISSPITLDISYVKLAQQQAPGVSTLFKKPEDSGYMGAKLAISDSNTTGKFLQQHFTLNYFIATKTTQFLDCLLYTSPSPRD